MYRYEAREPYYHSVLESLKAFKSI